MYEEEDDDLPLQYRRLTAHLQTNSSDFNRRLSAYLTSHQAMRNALSQALSNSYAQSAGQVQGNQVPQQQQQQGQQQQWMSQQSQPFNLTMPDFQNNNSDTSSPSTNRQPTSNWGMTPYPAVNGQVSAHQRSASIATPTTPSFNRKQEQAGPRRVSDPAPVEQSALSAHMAKMANFNGMKQTSANTVFPQPTGTPIWDQSNDLGPFATDLSNDARMFLDCQAVSSQYTAPGSFNKPAFHPSFNGMDQTLAPGALETKVDDFMWDDSHSTTADNFDSNAFSYNQDNETSLGSHISQPVTPGEDMWAFIDNSAFEESAT